MAADLNLGCAPSAEATQMFNNFWPGTVDQIRNLTNNDFRSQELPLARIKKIMKLDEDVKMISAEAPVLFAKATEIFVCELSLRAWLHSEENKRRTLQKNDIAMAISKHDQFDFLIDIVPREEMNQVKSQEDTARAPSLSDQIQHYLQRAQQQQSQPTQPQSVAAATQGQQTIHQARVQVQQPTVQVQVQQQQVNQPTQLVQQVQQVQQVPQASYIQQQTTAVQLPGGQIIQQPVQIQNVGQGVATTQPQILQVQTPQGLIQHLSNVQQLQQVSAAQTPIQQQTAIMAQQPTQVVSATPSPQITVVQAGTQVFQQVVTPSGEVQSIPIELTPQQLQSIQMQLHGKTSVQNIAVQSSQPQDTMAQLASGSQSICQIQQLPQVQHVYIQQVEGDEAVQIQEA